MSSSRTPPPLWNQRSWSPDMMRDETWERRKGLAEGRARSLTDDDIEELKACMELGFGFESSPEVDRRLTDTIPALELYYAVVNKQYGRGISRTSSMCSSTNSMLVDEDSDQAADVSSPLIDPCDDPDMVKARLRQLAQVVGCAVREAATCSPKLAQFSLE